MTDRPAPPDWKLANPAAIALSLAHARSKPSGGWLVLDASRTLLHLRKPRKYWIDGQELVVWASGDGGRSRITVAPAPCPHMGADLSTAKVNDDGCLVCPWHGLVLSPEGLREPPWEPVRTFDDGVLLWVQLDPGAAGATASPFLPERPATFIDGVIRKIATCEPRDVISNRLDPWHGTHFHPYAFHDLVVTDATEEGLDLEVSYQITPKHVVRVGARFDCPEPNTIVMTITSGEGTGSVVETHATPLQHSTPLHGPSTAIVEATLATSERSGFVKACRGASLARPLIKLLAGRLWRDDATYAERTYEMRTRSGTT